MDTAGGRSETSGPTRSIGRAGAVDAGDSDAIRYLAAMLRVEAHRARSLDDGRADPARTAEGWQRRCVVEAKRVEELVQLYRELGLEVAADPVTGSEIGGDHCQDCRLVAMLGFRVIYTRHPRDP